MAIVGESGSGKSTLLKLLMGFYDPTEGRILIDGVDLRDFELASLRARIGLVSQEPFIFNGTMRENIALGRPGATREEVIAAARAAGLDEFIAGLPERYETVIGERGANLSGGQRQRLAIARALLRKPEILIFDEATSHLDTATERAIQENLRTALAGKTVVLVAHRLSTIKDADLHLRPAPGPGRRGGDAPAVDAPGGAVLVPLAGPDRRGRRAVPTRRRRPRGSATPHGPTPASEPRARSSSTDSTPRRGMETPMRNELVLDLADCTEFRQTLLARPPRIVHGTAVLLVVLLGTALAWSAATRANLVVRAPGRVRPVTTPEKVFSAARGEVLSASVGGRVVEVNVREGDEVRQGDLLIRLETEPAGQRDRQAATADPGRGGGAGEAGPARGAVDAPVRGGPGEGRGGAGPGAGGRPAGQGAAGRGGPPGRRWSWRPRRMKRTSSGCWWTGGRRRGRT